MYEDLDAFKIRCAPKSYCDTIEPYLIGKDDGSAYGGEPVFMWNGVRYGVCFHNDGYCIAHLYGKHKRIYHTPDDVLEYVVGNDHLRDVVTRVTVISRNI